MPKLHLKILFKSLIYFWKELIGFKYLTLRQEKAQKQNPAKGQTC